MARSRKTVNGWLQSAELLLVFGILKNYSFSEFDLCHKTTWYRVVVTYIIYIIIIIIIIRIIMFMMLLS